jgi:Tfp pilus assembly protein PilN
MRTLIFIGATALMLLGCATSPAPSAELIRQTSHPTDIRIIDEPEKPTELGLVIPTWLLAIVTIALCVVTSRATDKVMKDAADQRRLALEREVNAAAHKLLAEAAHVGQLAPRVATAWQQVASLSGMMDNPRTEIEKDRSNERVDDTAAMMAYALGIVTSDLASKPLAQLTTEQKRLDEQLAKLEVMKEQIVGERAAYAEDLRFLRDKNTMEMLAGLLRTPGRFPPP